MIVGFTSTVISESFEAAEFIQVTGEESDKAREVVFTEGDLGST